VFSAQGGKKSFFLKIFDHIGMIFTSTLFSNFCACVYIIENTYYKSIVELDILKLCCIPFFIIKKSSILCGFTAVLTL
jgi:hypothetical protein